MGRGPNTNIARMFRDQDGLCHYCGLPTLMFPQKVSERSRLATIEHIVPKSMGGKNSISNYVMTCAKCNNRRGLSLLYCKCQRCSALIEAALADPTFIEKQFDVITRNIKPVLRKRGIRWVVRHDCKNYTFETWQQAMDFIGIVALDNVAPVG